MDSSKVEHKEEPCKTHESVEVNLLNEGPPVTGTWHSGKEEPKLMQRRQTHAYKPTGSRTQGQSRFLLFQ